MRSGCLHVWRALTSPSEQLEDNMERTWEVNAQEFKELDKGNGWPFAILVACSVVKLGKGEDKSTIVDLKVPASVFAKKAGTSQPRITRILAAWQKAAANGLVPDADMLSPEDAGDVAIPNIPWSKRDAKPGETPVYSVPATRRARPASEKPQPVAASVATSHPAKPLDVAKPERNLTKKEAAELIRSEPGYVEPDPAILEKINGGGNPMLDGLSEYADKTKAIRKHATALIDLLDGVADLRVFGDKTTTVLGELVDSIAPHLMGVE